MSTITPELRSKVDTWLRQDPNPETRKEIEDLVAKGDAAALEKRLGSRMVFGTAGLRGPVCAGYSCMNELTIIQAAQGLAKYIVSCFPDAKKRGIVIGYDARRKSLEFSQITAAAFSVFDIPSQMYSATVPTPFVPYLEGRDDAVCGVMVTASHNPAADNGYKVYMSRQVNRVGGRCDAIQINPPHDDNIERSIAENAEPWPEMRDYKKTFERARDRGLITDPLESVKATYFRDVSQAVQYRTREQNAQAAKHIRIAYSAMHGVGYRYFRQILEYFGFKLDELIVPVLSQVEPDGTFPTSAKPNPERPENMLLSEGVANESGANLVLANDPDADRLAMAERQPDGSWHVFHGNEIGALFAEWILANERERAGPSFNPAKYAMVNSTVSSKFISLMCRAEGLHYEEVLTGFRWIGSACARLEQQGITPLFGFEEAIGFMCKPTVLDKDGISAAACMCELAAATYEAGSTLYARYKALLEKYGTRVWNNGSFELTDVSVVGRVFDHLVHGQPESRLAPGYVDHFGEFRVASVRDLRTPGLDTSRPDRKPLLPVTDAPMLTYTFENGVVLTLRPSGTEPLLKYYSEGETHEAVDAVVEAARAIIKQFM